MGITGSEYAGIAWLDLRFCEYSCADRILSFDKDIPDLIGPDDSRYIDYSNVGDHRDWATREHRTKTVEKRPFSTYFTYIEPFYTLGECVIDSCNVVKDSTI
jgi:hypothetical protein